MCGVALKIYGILIAVLAAVGVFFGYMYYTDVTRPAKQLDEAAAEQDAVFEEIRQSFSQPRETRPAAPADPHTEAAQVPEETAPAQPKSAAVAWLTIPGTHIDYPVAQAKDNEFYLYRDINGKPNQRLGCPFLDYRCKSDFSGFNSIVYAHHMTKQRMFADIALYQDPDFMAQCPEGTLTTAEGVYTIRFFAYLTVPSDDAVYQAEFADETEKSAYLQYVLNQASYVYGVDEAEQKVLEDTESLHLLLLSTCTYEYQEARGVLVGVIR